MPQNKQRDIERQDGQKRQYNKETGKAHRIRDWDEMRARIPIMKWRNMKKKKNKSKSSANSLQVLLFIYAVDVAVAVS